MRQFRRWVFHCKFGMCRNAQFLASRTYGLDPREAGGGGLWTRPNPLFLQVN